ncbi:MAG: molybdopterin-dependent oxidoreductase [Caldilineaceae bacterium]
MKKSTPESAYVESGESMNRQAVEALGQETQTSRLSRRRFLALVSTGGSAAAIAAVAAQQGSPVGAAAQAQTPTATAAAPVTTPAADRLHVKPILEPFFIPHGTSVEMRWTSDATRNYLMDSGQFFVRNHSATPILNSNEWRLVIEGPGVSNPQELTYEDLLAMPAQTVTRFVECAGNGRSLFDRILDNPAQGTQWLTGGYGVGTWTGVPLSALLEQAGLNDAAVSIMASGLDEAGFEKPLPSEKALADDTLVVYGMNYGPLPHDHGFPARLLVPGWVGSYNVKWLGSLFVGDEQQYSTWNTSSYVLIGPEYEDPEGPPEGEIIREQTVKSVVALPWPATLEPGQQRITGYAWSPYASIAKVEVSLDEGEIYQPADVIGPNSAAAGTRWEFTFEAEPGELTITSRATDTEGNSQSPVEEQIWNQKGYAWSAVIPHPVTVTSAAATPTPTANGQAPPSATQTPTPDATPSPTAASSGQAAGALAAAGQQVYRNECANCHGPDGQGTLAPAVIGSDARLETYDTARGLYNYIRSSMPQDNPGSLTDQQYLEVTAYLLVENGYVTNDQMMGFDRLADIPLQ